MGELLAWVGGPKAIIGLCLPLIAMLARKTSVLYSRYRILGLGSAKLDVVLTASTSKQEPGVGFARPTTGRGSVEAFGTVVKAVGRYYRKLPINVHFASRLDSRLDADLICIGGPRRNIVTSKILAAHAPDIRFDDVSYSITAGDVDIDGYDLMSVDGVPTQDIGIVFMCASPFTVRRRRVVVCCGFTSYGTAGVAHWFFNDILTDSWHRPLARAHGIPRWRMKPGHCYLAVLEFQISEGTVIGERVLSSRAFQQGTA